MNDLRMERARTVALAVALALFGLGASAQTGKQPDSGVIGSGCGRCVRSVVHAAGTDELKKLVASLTFDSHNHVHAPRGVLVRIAELSKGENGTLDLSIAFGKGFSPARRAAQESALKTALSRAGAHSVTVNGRS